MAGGGEEWVDRPVPEEGLEDASREELTLGVWGAEGDGEDIVRDAEGNLDQPKPRTNNHQWTNA